MDTLHIASKAFLRATRRMRSRIYWKARKRTGLIINIGTASSGNLKKYIRDRWNNRPGKNLLVYLVSMEIIEIYCWQIYHQHYLQSLATLPEFEGKRKQPHCKFATLEQRISAWLARIFQKNHFFPFATQVQVIKAKPARNNALMYILAECKRCFNR